MKLDQFEERTLKNVGQNIWDAISIMKQRYGALLTDEGSRDRAFGEKTITRIYTFPGGAQIAVAMNKQKLSLLMREKTVDGRNLPDLLEGIQTKIKRYTDSEGGVSSSVLGTNAPFLKPSASNPLLRVAPQSSDVDALLALYLARPVVVTESNAPLSPTEPDESKVEKSEQRGLPGNSAFTPHVKRLVTADQLQLQLDRQAETGRAGEMIAVLDELRRLADCLCSEPSRFVERVALTDVGRGYDIASNWPGEERCIEVKSTSRAGSDFFITENERQVLTALGAKAWLYRVVVGDDGAGEVVARLQDPMNAIGPEQLIPVVWRVASKESFKLSN